MRRWGFPFSLASVWYWTVLIYLLLPLLVLWVMSFKDSSFVGFPITNWTLQWYKDLVADKDISSAFFYSVFISLAATAVAMPIGIWIGIALGTDRFWGRSLLFAGAALPAIVPAIINAISLRIFAQNVGVPPGTLALVLGLASHCVPFVVIMIMTRLRSMPKSHVEAAQDLGADRFMTFFYVTLPFLRPALLGALVFCLLISFDDFIRAFFLTGFKMTLPLLIYAKLSVSMSPAVTAIASAVVILTTVAGLYAERKTRKIGVR